METLLNRTGRILQLVENGLMALLLTAMILLAVGQILLRNLFDSGLLWADPTLRLLVLWLTLLGAIAATRDDRHIRIDLLSRFFNNRAKAWLEVLTDLFSAAVCGLIAWHSARFVLLEWQEQSQLFGLLPAWLGELIIPFGFGIMSLRFLLNIPGRFLNPKAPSC
jgi:TRAP-type C4-dicarboxylate transport system permease small subunit